MGAGPTAIPYGPENPVANVLTLPPGVSFMIVPNSSETYKSPELLKAKPQG